MVFGPSSPVQYGPYSKNCIVIRGSNDKVENITVEEVMKKIDLFLLPTLK